MHRTDGRLIPSMLRYSVAIIGPVGSAGAQFVLSLILLRVLGAAEFGSFSFLLITSQLSWGIWSALFCAPLPVLLAANGAARQQALLRCLFTTNLIAAAAAFFAFLLLAAALGLPMSTAGLFAAYAAVALLRWFARADAYARGAPLRTLVSDLTYAAAVLAGTAAAAFGWAATLDTTFVTLLAGTALGLLPFGRSYLAAQFFHIAPRAMADYAEVWRHSGWSLLGVVTTEATANCHVYIITIAYGPEGFAPLAASALLIRPINVAMNALSEFERAQMARQIGEGRLDAALGSVRLFRAVLLAIWTGTAATAVGVLWYAPHLVFPPQYNLALLAVGTAIWMAVAGMRLLRTPESTLLQAAGAFRPLAFASILSSGVSVAAVSVLLAAGGLLWSITGIMIGEAAFAGWIWRQTRRWRHSRELQPALPRPKAVRPVQAGD